MKLVVPPPAKPVKVQRKAAKQAAKAQRKATKVKPGGHVTKPLELQNAEAGQAA